MLLIFEIATKLYTAKLFVAKIICEDMQISDENFIKNIKKKMERKIYPWVN